MLICQTYFIQGFTFLRSSCFENTFFYLYNVLNNIFQCPFDSTILAMSDCEIDSFSLWYWATEVKLPYCNNKISYQIGQTFHSPCVSTKFQSKKIEVINTFSKLPSLCCILLYLHEVCWKWTFLGRTLSFVEQIWHDIWT